MKAFWICLAVLCPTFLKCNGKDITYTFNTSTVTSLTDEVAIPEDTGYIGNTTEPLTYCPQAFGVEGIFEITLPGLDPFPVLCDAQIAGAGYTVIASRSNVELNFFRNWTEYKRGFGYLSGDFFIGLDKLHAITKSQTYELYVHFEDFEGNTRFARYDEFYIENENELFKMSKLGTYTGDAGDSLSYHKNNKFSTYDNDNDGFENTNCALDRLGAWWYRSCTDSNLFGTYYFKETASYASGIVWYGWRGSRYSYKTMKMMLRPTSVLSCSECILWRNL
ncbi:microfibril-associated glycoprotein 4 [Drosophila willistoni]|uniref:microfibril-associated glycoprotein 4 n=1 Tax=Drosophila willistoni TaxID=7260 RepID=UPI000C26C73A|nr:microfibril-associated glycoprotein 4 [Drosophila willistoni]